MEEERNYGPKVLPTRLWLPDARLDPDAEISPLFKCVRGREEYPPIFAKNTWTKGVLAKDTQMYFKPTETIGTIFSPEAQNLRIQDMSRKKKKEPMKIFGKDGRLAYPPVQQRELGSEAKIAENKRKEQYKGLVHMVDLLSGDYHRRKKEEMNLKKKKAKMRKKMDALKMEGYPKEKEKERGQMKLLEAILPRDPDEQKLYLLSVVEGEMKIVIKEMDIERMMYYLTEGIDAEDLPPFDNELFTCINSRIPHKFKILKYYGKIHAILVKEVHKYHCAYMREHILRYVLKSPAERKRLQFQTFPIIEFPTLLIRAPVPWHTQVVLGKQFMEKHYFNGNIVVRKIRDLWWKRYGDMYLIPETMFIQEHRPTLTPYEFEETALKRCNDIRNGLINDWFPTCADIFLEYKNAWRKYIPITLTDTPVFVERFFNCVNLLLSLQLRGLVMKSLQHYRDIFIQFKHGNDFGDEYHDQMVFNTPIVTLIVQAVKGKAELIFDPSFDEISKMIERVYAKMLEIHRNLLKIEIILFPEFAKFNRYLSEISNTEPVLQIYKDEIIESFYPNAIGPQKYLKMYDSYAYILDGTAAADLEAFMKTDPFLKEYRKKIAYYETLKDELMYLRNVIPMNLFNLDCSELNKTLFNAADGFKNTIINHFVQLNRNLNREICSTFDDISDRASGSPETVVEIVGLQVFVTESRDITMYNVKEKIRKTVEILLFLIDYAHLSDEDIALNTRVFQWPKDMDIIIEVSLDRLSIKRDQAELVLKQKRVAFDKKIKKVEKMLNVFKKKDPPILTLDEMEDAVVDIERIVKVLSECKVEADNINEEEQLLNLDVSPYMSLGKMLTSADSFDKLWHTVYEFHLNYDTWYYGPFKGLDADEIAEYTDSVWKVLYKLLKALSDNPGAKRVAEMTKAKVEKFKQFVPVLQCVCNKGLQKRHWDKISEIVGVPLVITDESTLNEMIEAGMPKFITQLEEINGGATKEHALEEALSKMKKEWVDIEFELLPYRDTGVSILMAIDDIQVMMDDHILKAQTMRGSPYVKAFEEEMASWETKLLSMQDIIEQWLMCQSVWMYLEPIFSSEDIMRQMPTESRNFKMVDRTWRAIQANTLKDTHVLAATDFKNMLQLLKENNKLLDDIQKGLNDYLEKKRLFFPRFFFLSNDELLEILSETKDPLRVQPHLKKCFEGINTLEFNREQEILGMVSVEKERVPFSVKILPAEAKGMVEKWLIQVQYVMIQSLKDVMRDSIVNFPQVDRETWILSWPGQIVQCVNCIIWTTDVTEAIFKSTLEKQEQACLDQIEQSVKMVQGKLKPNNQMTVEALIVIDVHAKDIVNNLKQLKVTSVADFNWISQLRYYWKDMVVGVCMITTEIMYGFEYLGNFGRLVATPLTDRCYRTLMGALKLNLGGAPEGPAGTGKTETCKDLAKAVAKKCVVFNCSDGLDYKALGKFFKGLAQSGSWACFDEFNRIELEVLSVVAQQILTIQMAVAAKLTKFIFEGTELTLDWSCTCFITMNPGYAGRQELPDNLKVLFRTVAMMVPDYAMIGAISLFSYGFVQANSLAQKIVHTYKLCSEQLSSQNHYDYGMRAVKSVLIAAGALKREYPHVSEPQIVLRSIIDVNLPKFLAQDIALFDGIISDLFPNIEIPKFERSELIVCLEAEIEKKNLQATEWYMERVMQVYEMILVRHGLMVVGKPMGGKTKAYQCLALALRALANTPNAYLVEHDVLYKVINPKAISMGQLYGQFDPTTHEWSDGVLANTFREYAISPTSDRKWILFDGPVDAVWIENMNTVLDDNKKLCLMSGEIIQMSPQMNLIFEPADLEQASPATVSRCGMIYFEPHLLGWKPFMRSYLNTLSNLLLPEQLELLNECLEWLVPACLEQVNKSRKFVETSDIHLFYSFTRLFTCMLRDETQVSTVWLQCMFVFCLCWGLGSTLTSEGRKQFDVFYRKLLAGENKKHPKSKSFKLSKNQLFPERSVCFDFVYDKKNNGTWINWTETIEKIEKIPITAKPSELIIQTNESCLMKFFLRICLENGIPIMFIGPTGTGKSAVVIEHMLSMPREGFTPNIVNFSARTSSSLTQEMVMSKLDKRRRGVYGPAMGKQCLLFVDDLGMPQKEQWGAQPPVELLRHYLDHGYWFAKDTTMLYLVDILFVGAMGVPGGGRNEVTDRFLRHLQIITIDSFDDNTLAKIFTTILDWHFSKGYVDDVARLSKFCVAATTEVYKMAINKFLPTPAKSHYTFSLRDFSRVIMGLLFTPPAMMDNPDKFIRMWIHESYRVFHDRLIDDADRLMLFEIVKNASYNGYRQPMNKVCANIIPEDGILGPHTVRNLFYGNYINPDADIKIYDEITDMDDLIEKMNFYLSEYNLISKSPMNLVMFKFAIEHVSRVSRVLNQPNGNVLLVGVGGSGRHSAAKLATFMADDAIFEIELSRTYGTIDWRDDLKRLLMRAGLEGKPIVFLFADTQISDEGFIEDVNTILNTGDVPNLYTPDEKADILDKIQNILRESGVKKFDATPLALYTAFIERIRGALHLALCFSPIGESFRVRCRMFPSLINCCTIDWFQNWPDDALEMVAQSFLGQTDISPEMTSICVDICKLFHVTTQEYSDRFWLEQRRKTYVTATAFLELIQTFKALYALKVYQINMQRNRYEMGLEKLDFAAGQIGLMQLELHNLQPQLVIASANTEKLMVKIEQDAVIVEKQKEIVGADEALANEAAAASQAIKDDCESDLAEAIPALEAAVEALNTLKPADITVVKSMKNPPSGVKLVMEAVCVMKQVKPDRKLDPSSGKMIDDYWSSSVKVLGDMKFLESLKNYDKDNIPPSVMKKIRERYLPDREFDPVRIQSVSAACEGLCKWVRAIEVYDRIIKIVAPKQKALAAAEAELAVQMDKLNSKRAQLQEVADKLQALNDDFAAEMKKKKDLEDGIDLCGQKLERAEKLIGGLGGEKVRWSEIAANCKVLLHKVIGDVLLSAGTIAYLGPFTVNYRNELIRQWNDYSLEQGIPCSDNFSLVITMGEPVVIRAWNIAGLPIDNYSVENGIISTSARRWPLMIDPQGQANKWVKNMEKSNKLTVIKLTDSNYVRILENAITFGTPVLLENIIEEIDAILDPILVKSIFKQTGVWYMKFGDNVLEYNFDFRFYITTRLRNPHYLPEVAVKVTLVNFMLTLQGLQDQLLGIVVAREKPELEEKKNEMIVESANNKRTLKEIEDKILEVLSSSEGNILEDETAIKILSTSKVLSEDIQIKQQQAAITEVEIDTARNGYIPIAKHAAVLFFCISDMANIDPMYQYSLNWYFNLFVSSILNSPKSDNLEIRLKYLTDHLTLNVYQNICRSLFEKDKLIFSMVLSVGILRAHGQINEEVWIFLLTGGVALENPFPNPSPEWLTEKSWSEIVRASNLDGLHGFKESVESNNAAWRKFYDVYNPNEIPCPEPFHTATGLIRLILLRCIRPDKIVPAVQNYVVEEMGRAYLEPPQFNIEASYNDSNNCSPLVFILSPGSDPMAGLIRFAADKGIVKQQLQTISLGQGQGPIAVNMINIGLETGRWAVLQNCHLAESWMRELDRICTEVLVPENTHPNFRLWLTSYPSTAFPVSILQNGVKMTNEAPKGLRQNLLRSYTSDPISDSNFFNQCPNTKAFRPLLFSLCFFHAVIQERRKFGPLGWNIPYEFNESDLKICLLQLQMFLTDYVDVPYDALSYLTGECNYGGRVTDDKDRRLIMSLLSTFYAPGVVHKPGYPFSPSGIYAVPLDPTWENCLEYIKSLPINASPEVFGLHENADITKDNQETANMLSGILLTQALAAGGAGEADAQAAIVYLANDILNKIPPEYDLEVIRVQYPDMYTNSMNTVLKQELIRFNRLSSAVKKSLNDLIKAVKGIVVMSHELEQTYEALVIGKVPNSWQGKSYPSLKPLGSYVNDLLARLAFLQDWIDHGEPNVFWLSGFYFTQSFLTGVLQNFSRKEHYPIDFVHFEFSVSEYEAETENMAPILGVYCRGLFMEGARWDRKLKRINESFSKILFDTIPILILKPALIANFVPYPMYKCPVYKTSARRGVLATTGHSSNFVMFILLNSNMPEKHWINRGVASLCQLDD
ncbi:unnamed protein product [Phyllotreta striolata]|uniref:AAA+ ATPase domain-containing protein n=1 Tax=Phyllotreta striolata TaxID=444603 RepID=A0A9N9TMB8_PHYSR|nr:unnamed protein product [Phyllotreta striolata]